MVKKFTTRRVAVMGAVGLIRRVHPQEALRMLREDQAEFMDGESIRLRGTLSLLPRSEVEAAPKFSESSLKTTFQERLADGAKLIQHKRIDPAVAWMYGQAVADCRVVA